MKRIAIGSFLLAVLVAGALIAAQPDSDHDTQDVHGHEAEGGHAEEALALPPAQRQAAGVATAKLEQRALGDEIRAPGEVVNHAYRSAQVTPRISAQVVARHARLGEHIRQGQPLVTLSSVEMAQAQGDLLMADREWQRVQVLGSKVVSDRRYVEAQVVRQQAYAKVLAYGMTPLQVDAFLQSSGRGATGEFRLLAPREGTVVRDDFIEGEIVEPGRVLFAISDESVRWVEARMAPEAAGRITTGAPARVRIGNDWIAGQVGQFHQVLDEHTRTAGVRIEVPNPGDRLHPGLFVEVAIQTEPQAEALAVPQAAVLRSADGDWVVFVEEAGAFRPVEVEVTRTVGDLAVIEGLAPGTTVVTAGAFFLQSELAKSGFDVHQH